MTYLDRLKQRISEKAPDHGATKVTKAPFVPFVASRLPPLRQISTVNDSATIEREAINEPAVADQAEDLREHFEERAGILEYDAGLPRPEAELEAARITGTYARNRGYLWAALRAALASYPELLSQLPDKPGPVDTLPLGTAKLAVLNGRRVVRQGTFTGAHEVRSDEQA